VVKALRLKNGAVLVLDRFSSPSAAVVVASATGSLYEPIDGISHLLEHMLLRHADFDAEAEAETLGADINAYTDMDALAIEAEGLSETAPALIELMYRAYVGEDWAEADFLAERDAVVSELRQDRESPSGRVLSLALQALFSGPWAKDIGGTPESVSAIELRDIVEYKRRWLVGGNTVVVLTGGFSEDAVKRAAELFGGLEGEPPPKHTPQAERGTGKLAAKGEVDGVYYARGLALSTHDAAALHVLLTGLARDLENGKSTLYAALRARGTAYSHFVEYSVVGNTGYLIIGVESARSLSEASEAVAEALKPRPVNPRRVKYLDYMFYKEWRDPLARAERLLEYVVKGGDPAHAEGAYKTAHLYGSQWLPAFIAWEGEAALGRLE
jgi:predicted Zn-dependent peptidase